MVILALDSSSPGGSTALLRDGGVAGAPAATDAQHGELLPAELIAVLEQLAVTIQDVNLFAVAIGPGSFTGLASASPRSRGWRSRTARWWSRSRHSRHSYGRAGPARCQRPPESTRGAAKSSPRCTLLDASCTRPAHSRRWRPSIFGLGLAPLEHVGFVGDGAVRYRAEIDHAWATAR